MKIQNEIKGSVFALQANKIKSEKYNLNQI